MKKSELQQIIREEISKTLSEMNSNNITVKLNIPGYRETIKITNKDDIEDYKKIWRSNETAFGEDLYNVKSSAEHSAALRIYQNSKKIK